MPEPAKHPRVVRTPTKPWVRTSVWFALQALLWVALTIAFAATIEFSNLAPRAEALAFSATNWLPWVVLAPLVFWLSRRCPFERGKLLRSVPLHLIACAAVCFVMLWVGAYFAPTRGFRGGGGAAPWERRDPATKGDVAGPARDWRERARARFAEKERMERPAEGSATERSGQVPPSTGPRPEIAGEAPREPGERPWMERGGDWRPRIMPGGFRGGPPAAGGPGSSALGRTVMTQFWPPFSGIVLRANASAAVYLIIACFAHAFAYYRRAQEREREAIALAAGLSKAKLDALRLQLQPHFLFNALNAISTLVHRDANAADELIGDLSELLRLSLQTSEHEVPLSRELELLDCYLAIEQARLGDRLKIVREIEPQALAALVPTFVLQPLAENAIRHGIEPRRGPGTLTVRADLVGGNVRLVVADDGVGLKTTDQPASRRGIGIANTEERLRALHGESARLDIVSPESGGVQVQIVFPRRASAPAPSLAAAAGSRHEAATSKPA